MRILTVNVGSSSLKLHVVGDDDRVEEEVEVDAQADHASVLRSFIAKVGNVDAIAHRLVHGGPTLRRATIVDDTVRHELEGVAALAPLHMPPALALLDLARAMSACPQVACVDTAFHAEMPDAATTYALPAQWREWGVRRYGFHGLSYAWSSRRTAELLNASRTELQLLIVHAGSGVSACAVKDGRSVDTTMGFTPMEGAVMATRSGTVDPGALLWLQNAHQVTTADMTGLLEAGSGLVGLCGLSDLREVERVAAQGSAACAAAIDVYVHVLSRCIAGLTASLDRVDALVFTGGVGEHSGLIRTSVCSRLRILGVPATLAPADGDAVVAALADGPAVVVVTAREDAQMAREARELLLP
jgi:acetate kinase